MTVLQALSAYYDRTAAKGNAPPFGYSEERISYAVLLACDGALVDVQCLEDSSRNKPQPLRVPVPRPPSRTVNVAPGFLWDQTAYALGASSKGREYAESRFASFRKLHLASLDDSGDAGLRALAVFLRTWRPEQYDCLRYATDMLDKNIVFRLDDGNREFLHDRPASRRVWEKLMSSQGGEEGLCLVTGESGPLERRHPKVKGVRGAQSSGAPVVSFNQPAFNSFGRQEGYNAPICKRAAFAYATALNTLLSFDSRQRIQIGDTTTVFWAEAAENEREAKAAEDLLCGFLAERPSDEQEAAKVRVKLQAVAEGRPLTEIAPDVHQDTRVYVLGLAPNAGRLSIRFWHVDSIGRLASHLREHWQDLLIDPAPASSPPAAWRLLRETAAQRKSENVPSTLAGALMRAILTGGRYPRSLLAATVGRIRVDRDLNVMRAAICKAVLAREHRLQQEKESAPVTLCEDSNDVAYNLGRLFAAYAYAERSVARRNATIRDKYIGSASATPLRVFPVLMRGYEHNRSALAKAGGQRAGSGVRADKAVSRIAGALPRALPRSLGLEEQARFFVGYYHQDQAFYARKDDSEDQPRQSTESED